MACAKFVQIELGECMKYGGEQGTREQERNAKTVGWRNSQSGTRVASGRRV